MTSDLRHPAESEDVVTTLARQRLHAERHQHVRNAMRRSGVAALLLVDPVSIRYVTGASNMENFTVRVPSRYLLVLEPGPAVLYEYLGCEHLGRGVACVDEVRVAEGLNMVSSGGDTTAASRRFAAEIATVVRDVDPTIDRIAIDGFPFRAVDELRRQGFLVSDADDVLVPARAMKMPMEIEFMRIAMRRTERAVARLESALTPGATESQVWAELHHGIVESEGDYTAGRLFQSGPRTFPYFQECSDRRIEKGDLVCLDTDAVGIEGYCSDFSRSFVCGDVTPTGVQRSLYAKAREQLEHNAALLGPGVTYREIATKAWPIPPEHLDSRYYCIAHGLGMFGDFPNISHMTPGADYHLDGHLEPGMVFCVESYIGSRDAGMGVKLEDQFLVTAKGVERMSSYPFDDRLS